MKKIFLAALAAAALAMPLAASAFTPNSTRFFNDYDHYLVVYADAHQRVYADPDTIQRDPYSAGQLPVIRAITWAETYTSPMTYPALGNYKMVDHIYQYETAVGADQFGQSVSFKMLNTYKGAYTSDGKPAQIPARQSQGTANEAESIYLALYRASQYGSDMGD